jgi:hypothetical protein
MQSGPLNPPQYCRLPWNLTANALTWLKSPAGCNLAGGPDGGPKTAPVPAAAKVPP